jgi:diphthamide synthase (EF-2-diphthine--ammonia ligase)
VFHHDPFSTEGYSKLTFLISGGKDGGQPLMVRAMAGGKAIEADYVIQPKAKTWAVVEIPLKDINATGKTIDAISWQAQGNPYSAYYIARIQLE